MNRVKFVPANATARALNPLTVQVIEVTQRLNSRQRGKRRPYVSEVERLYLRRGWCRLSQLSAGARRRWLDAHREAVRGKHVAAV